MSEAATPSAERRLLAYDRKARTLLHASVALSLGGTALALTQWWLFSRVIARVFLAGEGLGDVSWLLVFLVALATARGCLSFGADWLSQLAASRLKASLRADVTRRLTVLGPAFDGNARTGELLHRSVQAVEDLDEFVAVYLPMKWLAALAPICVAIAIAVLDWFTVIILLITGPVLVLLLMLIGARARDATERRFQEMSWTSAYMLDMLQGLTTLKLFGRSRELAETMRAISHRNGQATMQVLRTAFETSFVLEICSALAVALVAVEVSLRLVHGALPFEVALALLMMTPEFFQPLRQLSARYHAGATGRTAAESIFNLLDSPAPGRVLPGPAACPPSRRAGDIAFDDVYFAYEAGRNVLNGFSLVISEGCAVALTGATGAGKSTLAKLLLRFMEPERGSILAGGVPIDAYDPAAWRALVAWVPQRPHLFYGSVADNIRLARPEATDEELIAAARAAFAHEFISQLPRGYDTPIGEHGSRLSGGEQQRLAIARAFLKDAPILVLDEPTSHLDASSEARVVEALRGLLAGRTTLIISHRPRLSDLAGQVVMLAGGRAVGLDEGNREAHLGPRAGLVAGSRDVTL